MTDFRPIESGQSDIGLPRWLSDIGLPRWLSGVKKKKKKLAVNAGDPGDVGLIPGLGISSGGGNGIRTPVSLPGKSHGQRSLAGYSPWGCKESDATGHRERQSDV